MTKSVDFLEFKNILNKNNIYLFDCQYRIAHNRLNNLRKHEQTGGAINVTNNIKKLNTNLLSRLVDSLLTKNISRSNWILDNY
jgi:hypothetical protein